jgi:hypothetical protein
MILRVNCDACSESWSESEYTHNYLSLAWSQFLIRSDSWSIDWSESESWYESCIVSLSWSES